MLYSNFAFANDSVEKQSLQYTLNEARTGSYWDMKDMQRRYQTGDGVVIDANKAKYWADKVEEIDVQKDLASAEQGDISAMDSLVKRYQTGKGVTKSAEQAKFWTDKIEAAKAKEDLNSAKRGDLAAMAAVVERYKLGKGLPQDIGEARSWQQKIKTTNENNRRKKVQKEIDDISYTEFLEGAKIKIKSENDPLMQISYGPTYLVVASAFDAIFSPFRLTKKSMLSKQLAAHPSAWAKPNSMIAKAYQQQQLNNENADTPLLALK